jgi:hypothetical protein
MCCLGWWGEAGGGQLGGGLVQVSSFDASSPHGSLPALSPCHEMYVTYKLGEMAEDQNEGQLANS